MANEDLVQAGQSAEDRPEGNAPSQEQIRQQQPPEQKSPQETKSDSREGWIPPKAHDAEKQRRRRAEQEAAQLRGYLEALKTQAPQQTTQAPPATPPTLPDWYTDPEAAWNARYQHKVQPEIGEIKKQIEGFQQSIRQQPQQVLHETSRMVANGVHGEEAVNAAYEALDTAMKADPRLDAEIKARLQTSRDPFGEIVRWHKTQSERNAPQDVEAEVERRLAERLAQMNGGYAPQSQPYAPQQPYPSNFANSRNAGGKQSQAWGGPKPLSEVFGR